jgi:hypothetical protein
MIQRGQNTRFALEPRGSLDVGSEPVRQNFYRDAPTQLGVGRLVHIAHASRTEVAGDLVVRKATANHGAMPARILIRRVEKLNER